MVTEGTGSNEPIKSNVSLGALGNPNPNPEPNAGGTGNPDPNGNPHPQGTPPNGQPSGDGNPPAGNPNPNGSGNPPSNAGADNKLPETFNELLPFLSANSNDNAEVNALKGQLLETFKATAIDDKGNLLDATGDIIFKAETLQKFIDSDELPVNEKGELVNDKGEVIRQVQTPRNIVADLKTSVEADFGIQFADDVDFPDTEEGLKLLIKESVKAKSTNAIKSFLESNPALKGFYQHLALGGSPETYSSNNVDYKSINIKTLDEGAKVDLLNKMFTAQGLPNKDNMLNLIKTAGQEELDKAVAGAVLYLDHQQTEKTKAQEAQLLAQQEQEAKAVEAYWEDVNKLVVKEGKLGRVVIPTTDREAFFNYMARPVDDDYNSADSLAAQKDSLEFQTLVSYLRFKGGDISKLASIIASEKRLETLAERMARIKETDNGEGVPRTVKGNSGSGSISLGSLLGQSQNK